MKQFWLILFCVLINGGMFLNAGNFEQREKELNEQIALLQSQNNALTKTKAELEKKLKICEMQTIDLLSEFRTKIDELKVGQERFTQHLLRKEKAPIRYSPSFDNSEYSLGAQRINPNLIGKGVKDSLARLRILCPELADDGYIINQIQLGALWAYRIINQDTKSLDQLAQASQAEHLNAITAVMWFLYAHGLLRGQEFKEGNIIIEDPGFKFLDFFLQYAKRVNPEIYGTIKDHPAHVSNNPFAYPRESSHFKKQQNEFRQYGIDVRFDASAPTQKLMPPDKTTLLFGVADKQKERIFLKPENYGLFIGDGALGHVSEYVTSLLRKKPEARAMGLVKESDDDPSYRKERIPAEFLSDFAHALEKSNLPEEQKNELLLLAKEEGIKSLYLKPDLIRGTPLEELAKRYDKKYDHAQIRSGRELIVTHQELKNSLQKS